MFFLIGVIPHVLYLEIKANFCGRKKEGHFHYKNFLRALKWVPTWYTYTVGTKSLLSDWLQFSVSQSERSILCLPCRYVMWVLILKLSKSFYNESDLLFYAHKSWLSIWRYRTCELWCMLKTCKIVGLIICGALITSIEICQFPAIPWEMATLTAWHPPRIYCNLATA